MKRVKATDDLRRELKKTVDIGAYIKENQASLVSNYNVSNILTELYKGKDISKAQLARNADMSEVYLHQVFSGRRKPSRDKMICLCIGLGLTLEEAQRCLKLTGFAELYLKNKRELIIYHGLIHQIPLQEINDRLFEENEKVLS